MSWSRQLRGIEPAEVTTEMDETCKGLTEGKTEELVQIRKTKKQKQKQKKYVSPKDPEAKRKQR